MNIVLKKSIAIALILLSAVLVMAETAPEAHAAKKSQKYWMQKTLKAYRKNKIKKAMKYNKKLKKYAKEKCVKRMTRAQKNLYIRIIDSYPVEDNGYGTPYLWDYYLTDYNGDGKADLIVKYGTCEADKKCKVFTCVNGKKKCIGTFWSGHSYLCKNTGGKGVIMVSHCTGNESLDKIYRKNGKTVVKRLRSRNSDFSPFFLRNQLRSHARWSEDFGSYFSYDELYA